MSTYNPYESEARREKADALTSVMTRVALMFASSENRELAPEDIAAWLRRLPASDPYAPTDWQRLAAVAGVHMPSPKTRAMVIASFERRGEAVH